jgi:transcriptional regulator with XRE-family HTH domain
MNNVPMASLETIGRKIAKLRAEKGLSQEDLAGEAEVNRGYISRIENGHVAFSLPVFLKIAEALRVKPEELFKK